MILRAFSATPMERASARRFPAWTAYARAFSGNRVDAERIVQRAFRGSRSFPAPPASETDAHERMLGSIRVGALRSLQPAGASQPQSVLGLLEQMAQAEVMGAAAAARRRLSSLPRPWRRTLERFLFHRPPSSAEKVALREGLSSDEVEMMIESGLRNVAAAVRAPSPRERNDSGSRHPELAALGAFVRGALSGDEARALAAHSFTCTACGDRLGTMMLLRSSTAERLRMPLVSSSLRRGAIGVLLAAAIAGGALLYQALRPNPWKEHATHETVPPWFRDFLYRGEEVQRAGAVAKGLDALVQGDYPRAIAILEPLASPPDDDPEAATYLGIARMLTQDASSRTMRLLEAGTTSSRVGRLARWYLANLLLVRGDVRRAREELHALESIRDWFGRAAESLLKELDEAERAETPTVARVGSR